MSGWQLDEEDFMEEQNLVARLVHMLVNDNQEQAFQVTPFESTDYVRERAPQTFLDQLS